MVKGKLEMRTLFHPKMEDIRVSEIFHALSDPTRLDIMRSLLLDPSANCSTLYPNMPKSTRSHHFRILRESGLTSVEVVGTSHRTTLRRAELDSRFPGLLDAVAKATDPV